MDINKVRAHAPKGVQAAGDGKCTGTGGGETRKAGFDALKLEHGAHIVVACECVLQRRQIIKVIGQGIGISSMKRLCESIVHGRSLPVIN